jgi:LacI family transcriptional regulator
VSPATVSRVLNGHPSVAAELADRVHAAVAVVGYRPNAAARSLRRRKSSLWAVVVPDVSNPYFTEVVRGVEDVAQPAGYSVVLCNSDENPEKEASYIAVALGEQVAGLIICPTSERSTDVSALLAQGTPVVAVDRKLSKVSVDTVLVDNVRGAEAATAHLIDAGFQHVACITGPKAATTARQRLSGYRRALRSRGRDLDDGLVRHTDFQVAGGREAMASLLEAGEVDAVFAANNLITVGVLEAVTAREQRVPEDVGVVSFDDIPWASIVRPSLTTVAQPTYEIGRRSGELLLSRIELPDRKTTSLVLATALTVRDSSRRTATRRGRHG